MSRQTTYIAIVFTALALCFSTGLVSEAAAQSSVPPKGGVAADANPASSPGVSGDSQQGTGGGAARQGEAPSVWAQLIPFALIFLIFWFLIIRPQSKKQKAHDEMVKVLKKGDEVITQSGIFGRIADFDDKAGAVVLEIAKDVRIRVVRSQVGGHQGKQKEESST